MLGLANITGKYFQGAEKNKIFSWKKFCEGVIEIKITKSSVTAVALVSKLKEFKLLGNFIEKIEELKGIF